MTPGDEVALGLEYDDTGEHCTGQYDGGGQGDRIPRERLLPLVHQVGESGCDYEIDHRHQVTECWCAVERDQYGSDSAEDGDKPGTWLADEPGIKNRTKYQ